MPSVDTSAILKSVNSRRDEYVSGLEKDWSELQEALKPLREAEDAIARAIHEAVGQWPADYNGAPARVAARSAVSRGTSSTAARSTESAEARQAKILEALSQNAADGVNGATLASTVGASPATVRKDLEQLEADNKVKRTGERRGTKYFPA
jgi:hypothetical protein